MTGRANVKKPRNSEGPCENYSGGLGGSEYCDTCGWSQSEHGRQLRADIIDEISRNTWLAQQFDNLDEIEDEGNDI